MVPAVVILLFAATAIGAAQTMPIDFDDGIPGIGIHEASIRNGGFEEDSAGQTLPTDAGPDSENVLDAMICQSATGRTVLGTQNPIAIREGNWKLHTDNNSLYNVASDPAETSNVVASNATIRTRLQTTLDTSDVFRIVSWETIHSGGSHDMRVTIAGRAGRIYALVESETLAEPWNTVAFIGPLASDQPVVLDCRDIPETRAFVRARVHHKPTAQLSN